MGNCVSLQQEEGEEPDVQQVLQETSPSAKRLRASASSAYLRQSSRDGVNLLLRPSPSAHSLHSLHSVRSTRGALGAEVKARRASATPTSSAPSQTLLTNQLSTPASCRRGSLPLSPEGSPAFHPLAPSPTAPHPNPTPATARASTSSSSAFLHKSMRDSAVSVSAPHTPPLPTAPTHPARGTPPPPSALPPYRAPSTRKPVSHAFMLPSPYDSPAHKSSEPHHQNQQQQLRTYNSHCDAGTCTPDAEDRVVVADLPLLPSHGTGSTSMPSSPFALAQRGLEFVDMDTLHDTMFRPPTQPPGASPKAISSPSNLASAAQPAPRDAQQSLPHTAPAAALAAAPAAVQPYNEWLAAQQAAAKAKQAELEWSDSAEPCSCVGHVAVGDEPAKGSGRVVGVVPGCAQAEAEWFLGVGGKAQGMGEQWQLAECGEQGVLVTPQEQEQQQWQRVCSDQASGQLHEGSGCMGSQRASWAPPQGALRSSSNVPGMSARHTSAYSYHASMRASSRECGLSVPEAMPSADWHSMHMAMAVAVELGETVPMSPEGLALAGSKEERRSTGHSSGTLAYAPLFTTGSPALKRIASTGSNGHRASSTASDMRLSSCGTGLRLSRNASSSRTTPSGQGSSRHSPNTLAMTSGGIRVSPSSNGSAAAADAVAALTDAFTGRKSARTDADSMPDARVPLSLPQQHQQLPALNGAQTKPAHMETLAPLHTSSPPQAPHHAGATTDKPDKLDKLAHHTPLPALVPVSESPHSLVPSDASVTSMTNNISGSNGGAAALACNGNNASQAPSTHAHATHAQATHAHATPAHAAHVPGLRMSPECIRLQPHERFSAGGWDSRAVRMAQQAKGPHSSGSLGTPSASSPVSAWNTPPHTTATFANPPWSPQPHMLKGVQRAHSRAREVEQESVPPGEPGCVGGFSPVSESIRVYDDDMRPQPRLPRVLTVRTPNNNSSNNSANSGVRAAHPAAPPQQQQQQQHVLEHSATRAGNPATQQQQQHSSAQAWEQQQQQQQRALMRSATCARSSAPSDISPYCHLAAAAHARVHGTHGSPHTQAHVTGGCGRDASTLLANSNCASALVGLLPQTQHQPLPPYVRYLNGGGRSSAAAVQGLGAQGACTGDEGGGGAPFGVGVDVHQSLRGTWVATAQPKPQGCSPNSQVRGPPPLYTSASVRDEHELLALQGFFSPRSPGRASLSPPVNGSFQRQSGPWQ